MRLAQLHDWLGGQGWYDLHQSRVAGGYELHWSRLIDAGLAGTLWIFGLFFDGALAERLMRTAWPMLWLIPTMAATAAIAWRIAGREAALMALLLAVVGLPAFHQFRPGRIDHHNVQIALSLLAVAATVWSDRVRWAATLAGALTGLAMAIGLECLPYLLVCAGAFGVRYVLDPNSAGATGRYGVALAASSLAGFFAIIGPAHWASGMCDEIAINWVALTVVGGLGLALAATFESDRVSVRGVKAILIGAVRGRSVCLDRAPLPARALRHDGPRRVADLACACARDAAAHRADRRKPAHRASRLRRSRRWRFSPCSRSHVQRETRGDFGFLAAAAAFLYGGFVTTFAAVKAAFVRDLARHAAGRLLCAASVRVRCGSIARAALGRRACC